MPTLFYRINGKGEPVQVVRQARHPFGAQWKAVTNVVNGPVPTGVKKPFKGNKRYFLAVDSDGAIIPTSLVVSSTVPQGSYLELHRDGLVTLPDASKNSSGGTLDTVEDLSEETPLFSNSFLQNGSFS